MKRLGSDKVMHRILTYEGLTFAFLIGLVWLNERFHFPSMIWGADKKVFEWEEAMLETSFIILAAVFVMSVTRNMLRRMHQLEGILPICSSCKNIKDEDGNWQRVEHYVHEHSHADFSHSLCPDCAREYSKEAGIAFDTQMAGNS